MVLPATETTLRWSGDTTPATVKSAYQTSCGFGIAPEQAFAFSFDAPVQLKITLNSNSGTRMAYELIEGPCEEPGAPRFCATNSQVFLAQADTEYIIIVEPEANQARGTFELEVEVKPLACLPVSSKRCDGDDVKRCVAGGLREDSITCGAPCVDDTCGADSCGNAVVVNPGDYPFSFAAAAAGYVSSITFEGDNSCANPDRGILPGETNNADPTGESDPSLPTPGQDVHFTLKGLTAGQLLTVDASEAAGDAADSAIFILDSCDKSECLFAKDLGDVVSQWEVPADGDYLVIVDRLSSSDQDLGVLINVE